MTPEQVRELTKAAAARATGPLSDKIIDLSNKLGVTEDAALSLLRIIGEADVPLEQLPQKLAEVAAQFQKLQAQLAALNPQNRLARNLVDQAQAQTKAGNLAKAHELLSQAKEAEIAAAQQARELRQKAEEAERVELLQAAASSAASLLRTFGQPDVPLEQLSERLDELENEYAKVRGTFAMSFIERWWRWLVAAHVGVLILLNAGVLFRARWSTAAWRIATDDSWGTAVLRLSAVLLRHWTIAQLWILDLYVQKQRAALPSAAPYLPLPLVGPEGQCKDSDELMGELPARRRLWVQGGSGMGKTALVRNLVETHFRTATSAFVPTEEIAKFWSRSLPANSPSRMKTKGIRLG
jgi:hypothetical protein